MSEDTSESPSEPSTPNPYAVPQGDPGATNATIPFGFVDAVDLDFPFGTRGALWICAGSAMLQMASVWAIEHPWFAMLLHAAVPAGLVASLPGTQSWRAARALTAALLSIPAVLLYIPACFAAIPLAVFFQNFDADFVALIGWSIIVESLTLWLIALTVRRAARRRAQRTRDAAAIGTDPASTFMAS